MRETIFKDKHNEWRWHVQAKNNKIIGTSGEGYKTRYGAELALRRFMGHSFWLEGILLLLLLLMTALFIWALATRNTEVIKASSGTGQINQQPQKSPALSPQPASGLDQPNTQIQGK